MFLNKQGKVTRIIYKLELFQREKRPKVDVAYFLGFVMNDICCYIVQKASKRTKLKKNSPSACDSPRIVANNQASNIFLGDKIIF